MSAQQAEVDMDGDRLINWEEEATAIINDVKMHVAEIFISEELPNSGSSIYLNIRTNEDKCYCVHVSARGFRIVGTSFDTKDPKPQSNLETAPPTEQKDENDDEEKAEEEDEVFETPYALLDKISPRYVDSFGNLLRQHLLQLQLKRMQFREEDEEDFLEEDEEEEGDEDDNDTA